MACDEEDKDHLLQYSELIIAYEQIQSNRTYPVFDFPHPSLSKRGLFTFARRRLYAEDEHASKAHVLGRKVEHR